ncbi:MAG: hypothetical protein ACK4OO_00970 [bacterium]
MRKNGFTIGVASGMILIFTWGCELKQPGLPVWSIEATIPFSERVYRMEELLTDSEKLAGRGWGFVTNPIDGTMLFVLRQSFLEQRVEDRMTYQPSDTGRFTNTIDTIDIDETLTDADTILVEEANPDLFPGFRGPVGAFSFETHIDTLRYENIHWADIVESYLMISATNHFPFPVDTLILHFRNLRGREELGEIILDRRLNPGESWQDSLPLHGKRVEGEILITTRGYSPGSADPVVISGEEKLEVVVNISHSRVLAAEAEIPQQRFSQSDTLNYDDPNRIVRAVVKQGRLYYRLYNQLPLEINVATTLTNFTDPNGNPIISHFHLDPSRTSEIVEVDLSGMTITMDLHRQNLAVISDVEVVDSRQTRFQGRTHQIIDATQGLDVEYWTDQLIFSLFEGSLDSIRIEVPSLETSLHLPEGLDSINFTRDTLFLHIENNTLMRLFLSFDILATNSRTGEREFIPVRELITPGLNTITIPNADRLVRVIPDTVRTEGWGGLGRKFLPGEPLLV